MNITCNRTGDRYISEARYFEDWDEFRQEREYLFRYLMRHGTISQVTLDLSDELARTNDTYIAGLKTRHVDATAYESPETSGYFLIFSTDFFPEPGYFIAYYGIAGPAGPKEQPDELETRIMTTFPGMMESRTYTSNPDSPLATHLVPVVAGVSFAAPAIGMVIRALRR